MSHAKPGGLPDPDLTSFTLVLHEKMVSRPWNFPLSILKLIQEQGGEWVIRRIDSSWRLIMDIYVVIICHNVINSVMSIKMQMIGDVKCCRYTMVPG